MARTDAALLVAPPEALLCDVSAAAHWGLPLPPWIALSQESRPVAVAVRAGSGRPQRVGVRGRRLLLPAEHVMDSRGHRVTTAARTWVDCAELIPLQYLVAMGDVVVRRELASTDDLAAVVRWARGRRGVRSARVALPILDGRAESPGESWLRCHLVLCGVPRPSCNYDVVVDGEWLARADIAWPERRVIVEYDGIVHLAERQRRHDAARRNLLQEAGWLVIVFTAADLRHPEAMADMVKSALRRRAPASGE